MRGVGCRLCGVGCGVWGVVCGVSLSQSTSKVVCCPETMLKGQAFEPFVCGQGQTGARASYERGTPVTITP